MEKKKASDLTLGRTDKAKNNNLRRGQEKLPKLKIQEEKHERK